LPLNARRTGQRVGVLELYLPYAPIGRDVTGGLHQLYLYLAIGLTLLYLVLFLINHCLGKPGATAPVIPQRVPSRTRPAH
jgi:hypothetical protein